MSAREWLKDLLSIWHKPSAQKIVFQNQGYCPICERNVKFIATGNWFRDYYLCSNCGSIPRERALMQVLQTFFPDWTKLVIHESSPIARGTSTRLARHCKNYLPSQFFQREKLGTIVNGVRCENLEALTFPNESIDLHITQDVLEHVLFPEKAFREIARTLKPGGAHVFTVPLVNKNKPSKFRAKPNEVGEILYIETPLYHGNPISKDGSLVTVDWGFDICKYIFEATGLFTFIIQIDDISKGIRAEFIEVLITIKPDVV